MMSSLSARALKPIEASPTPAQLFASLATYGIPEVVYPTPFYSNPMYVILNVERHI